MTSTRRPRLRGLRDRLSGDGGFALIEVMVSAVLVVVLATATLNIIDRSGAASAATRMRATATGLAQEDQDSMRVMSIGQLDQRDTTYPKAVAGVTFSIHSVAQWVRDSGKAVCDSSSDRVEYLKTTTEVTWPGHTANPVTVESYISPGVEAISKGALMVKLHTDPGVGVGGVTVRLSTGQSGLTDQTGCVKFTGLDAGTISASWDGTLGDYVDRNGIQTPSESVVIGAGQTAQLDRLWDKAGSAVVRWVDENRQAVLPDTPTTASGGLGAGVVNSLINKPTYTAPNLQQMRFFDNQTNAVAVGTPLDPHIAPITMAGQTTKISELFPFTQAYSVFAGGCGTNVPPTTYTMPTVRVPAGGDAAQIDVLVPTAVVQLNGSVATSGTNGGGTIARVRLLNTDTSAFCIDSNAVAASAGTSSTLHVPAGTYNICIQKTIGSTSYIPATLLDRIVPAQGGVRTTAVNLGNYTNWKTGTC